MKLCGDFVREHSIQRNLRAELPLATLSWANLFSLWRASRQDSGAREREKAEEQKLEHAFAVPFNLRGNIFGVRRLSAVFYKVVTKVALIFTLAASFWQSALPGKYCFAGLIRLVCLGRPLSTRRRASQSRLCGVRDVDAENFIFSKWGIYCIRRKSERGNVVRRNSEQAKSKYYCSSLFTNAYCVSRLECWLRCVISRFTESTNYAQISHTK